MVRTEEPVPPRKAPAAKPTGATRRFVITVGPDGAVKWKNHGLNRWEALPILAAVHAEVAKSLEPEGESA